MFKRSLHSIDHFHLFSRLLAILQLLTPWSALADVAGLCSDAELLVLDTTFRGYDDGRRCYRLDVPSPGVLAVDASAPGSPKAEPRLVFLGGGFDADPGAMRHRVVQETPRGVVVELGEPGTLFVLVGPEDPAQPLVGYKFRTAFAALVPTKDVDEDDEDGSEIKSLRKPTADPADRWLAALCRRSDEFGADRFSESDDHADTPLCATPLELGGSVSGTIDNAAGDDEDFFTFVVDELRSVRIDATAGHLTLYDGRGQRLASSAGDMTRPGLVRALSSGRYYLRLQNVPGGESVYVLNLGILAEP